MSSSIAVATHRVESASTRPPGPGRTALRRSGFDLLLAEPGATKPETVRRDAERQVRAEAAEVNAERPTQRPG